MTLFPNIGNIVVNPILPGGRVLSKDCMLHLNSLTYCIETFGGGYLYFISEAHIRLILARSVHIYITYQSNHRACRPQAENQKVIAGQY